MDRIFLIIKVYNLHFLNNHQLKLKALQLKFFFFDPIIISYMHHAKLFSFFLNISEVRGYSKSHPKNNISLKSESYFILEGSSFSYIQYIYNY